MISGSGRHGDKSVAPLSGGGARDRAYETARRCRDQLPTARASFVSSVLEIAGIDQTPYEFRHRGTRPLFTGLVSLHRSGLLSDNDRTINDIDRRSRALVERRGIRRASWIRVD